MSTTPVVSGRMNSALGSLTCEALRGVLDTELFRSHRLSYCVRTERVRIETVVLPS